MVERALGVASNRGHLKNNDIKYRYNKKNEIYFIIYSVLYR